MERRQSQRSLLAARFSFSHTQVMRPSSIDALSLVPSFGSLYLESNKASRPLSGVVADHLRCSRPTVLLPLMALVSVVAGQKEGWRTGRRGCFAQGCASGAVDCLGGCFRIVGGGFTGA